MRIEKAVVVVVGAVIGGCAATPVASPSSPDRTVDTAFRQRDRQPQTTPITYRERKRPPGVTASTSPGAAAPSFAYSPTSGSAVAEVNGRRIDRSVLVNLLIRSRGAELLEQLVAYEAIQALATEKNLTINESDVAYERRMAAERVGNPWAAFTTTPLDDTTANTLLQVVLEKKNISASEFDMVLRRNAYLRKIIGNELHFSEAQYRDEFERAYGPRVLVRHIQLATPAEVTRVRAHLDAGEPFEAVAKTYSANQASAQQGGRLTPFSRSEDQLPEAFRQAAFALEPGVVSGAVRVGEWYHLILVEERIPARRQDMGRVRDELTRRLRRRLSEGAMFALYEKVVKDANIRVFDPVLREAYLARMKQRSGS